jgi:restriction endonuclease S subunit
VFAYASDFMYDGEVILLGRKGTIDKPLYFIGKFWAVDTMFYATILNKNIGKFLYYVSKTVPFKFYSTATAIPSMTQKDLNNNKILLPPKQEQTAIANFLDRKTTQIDKAIAQKEQLIELLKERRQILIHEAVTQGLDKSVEMKDSGVEWVGEVPKHWEVKKLKYACNLVSEKLLSKDTSLKYIGMENIISWTGQYILSNSETEGLSNHFKKGDILFGKLRPYLAKVYLTKNEGICSTEFLVYRTKENIINTYVHKLMLSYDFINIINASTYGSKMPRANSEFIGNQLITIPPIKEQIEIANYIDNQSQKIKTAISLKQQEIASLKEYKTVLIDAAVTGKVMIN